MLLVKNSMFGFLMVVFVILVITCSLVSVILCYFFLCAEDYNWHWRSFMISGASGFYVFLYSVVFFSRKLRKIFAFLSPMKHYFNTTIPTTDLVNMTSSVLFFGWSLVFSGLFTIFTGAIGFIATFIFVRLIFGSIKVD